MKEKVNVLLLGSGGRESALAWKISASPRLENLFVAPGNASSAGTRVNIGVSDFEAIKDFALRNDIDMIVVGPEQPLVDGIADFFEDTKIKVIGPSAEGARLEGSKEFAKEFMFRHGIPTARFMTVTAATKEEGFDFLESLEPPYVLKADGLAAGKGVMILPTLADAKDALDDMLAGKFGTASSTVIIEEYLDGVECSVFLLTDGDEYRMLPAAKDYKRIGEGDTGPNTGGMGAVSPVCFADEDFMEKVRSRIADPTIKGLKEEEIDYRGIIFLGLINVNSEPYVIEYNARFGDPETEAVLPRLKSDIISLFEGIADRTVALKKIEIDPRAAVTVILASEGYPDSYKKGYPISNIPENTDDLIIFPAGADMDSDGNMITSGGRVMAVTALADTIEQAAETAKHKASEIRFEGKYFRKDIADDLCRMQTEGIC